jgi:hypothetical protein
MAADQFPELSIVELQRDVEVAGAVLPAGHRGIVVLVWDEGRHYTVEFTEPRFQVVDVARDDLRLVTAFA